MSRVRRRDMHIRLYPAPVFHALEPVAEPGAPFPAFRALEPVAEPGAPFPAFRALEPVAEPGAPFPAFRALEQSRGAGNPAGGPVFHDYSQDLIDLLKQQAEDSNAGYQ